MAAAERLHDPIFFQDDIVDYMNGRFDAMQKAVSKKKITDMTFVATAIGAR